MVRNNKKKMFSYNFLSKVSLSAGNVALKGALNSTSVLRCAIESERHFSRSFPSFVAGLIKGLLLVNFGASLVIDNQSVDLDHAIYVWILTLAMTGFSIFEMSSLFV